MVVDSCLDVMSGRPWALRYLESIGCDVDVAIRVIVVTHYDDDHIRGIAELATAATSAQLVCSGSIARKDVIQFVVEQERASSGLGSGVDELRTLLRLGAKRGGIVWAKANLPLFPRPPGDNPVVIALSPSENAVERSIEALILAAASTESRPAVARRFRAPDGPNMSSVATRVRAAAGDVLLGADLEKSNNVETGWDAVLRYAKPSKTSSLFKIPHHASQGAHHDDVWHEMLDDDVVGIVTPWEKAGNFLPLGGDLDRLRNACASLYVTAVPAFRRARMDPAVERLVRRLHGGDIQELVGDGAVRARKRPNDRNWRVELFGDAKAVS